MRDGFLISVIFLHNEVEQSIQNLLIFLFILSVVHVYTHSILRLEKCLRFETKFWPRISHNQPLYTTDNFTLEFQFLKCTKIFLTSQNSAQLHRLCCCLMSAKNQRRRCRCWGCVCSMEYENNMNICECSLRLRLLLSMN